MAAMQAIAARIFPPSLDRGAILLDERRRLPARVGAAASRDLLGKNKKMDALNPQSGLKPQVARPPGLVRRAHRNLLLLACCQAVGQSCNTMMFAATGLSVITFYHRPDLANLPVTMQHLGVMIWVFPAALLMQRMGRSIGFRVGSLFGMTGTTVMCIGLYSENLLVMCAGGLILGYAVACMTM